MDKSKIENIIDELELSYVEWVDKDLERRKELLPLIERNQIQGLIWNLLSSEKYRGQINYKEYKQILNTWFDRLNLK